MSLNILLRTVYLFYLEISICATLALSLGISKLDLIYASILLLGLILAIISLLILYCKDATMHPAKTYEKRKSRSYSVCCWERSELRYEDDIEEVTREGMAKMDSYS